VLIAEVDNDVAAAAAAAAAAVTAAAAAATDFNIDNDDNHLCLTGAARHAAHFSAAEHVTQPFVRAARCKMYAQRV
jgi:hypothetical protein